MKTIISVHNDSQKMGYAIFEGAILVDWGTKRLGDGPITERIAEVAVPFVRSLIKWNEPQVLILANPMGSDDSVRGLFWRVAQQQIFRYVDAVETFDRNEIREAFRCNSYSDRLNKDSIMQLLAKTFPELQIRLPKPRRPWQSPDYWTPMFDAVALAVTYLRNHENTT